MPPREEQGRTSMIFPKLRGGPEASLQRFSGRDVLSVGNTISTKTIIVLDDDPTSRKVFYWILERTHRVVTAATGDEAISLCQEQRENIGLLVADVCLRSAVSGIQVAVRVRESCPDIAICLTSG